MASSSTKKGEGRKSLKIEKIEKKSTLQVTFSKRKSGLFKKAFELSVLTEAEIAAVVFSPGGKAYSFGHPSVEIVADKFLGRNSQTVTNAQQQERDQRNADIAEKIEELKITKKKLEAEKKRGKELDRILEQGPKTIWDDGKDPWKLKQSLEFMKDLQAQVETEIRSRANMGNDLAQVNDTP